MRSIPRFVAAVVLIAFGNKIKEWFMSAWESITGKKVDSATDVKED